MSERFGNVVVSWIRRLERASDADLERRHVRRRLFTDSRTMLKSWHKYSQSCLIRSKSKQLLYNGYLLAIWHSGPTNERPFANQEIAMVEHFNSLQIKFPKNERFRSNESSSRYSKIRGNSLAIESRAVSVVALPLMHKVRKRWIWLHHTSPQAGRSA